MRFISVANDEGEVISVIIRLYIPIFFYYICS
jgi:hypothetical protein